MATTQIPVTSAQPLPPDDGPGASGSVRSPRPKKEASIWDLVMGVLSSLRLTVVLLVMLTFLVFVGTLAQANYDVWYVVDEAYFRVWIATVEFQTLATLIGVFRQTNLEIPGKFYFPGGFTIGLLMVVNLLAAHAYRFKIASRGVKLLLGTVLLAIGSVASVVILTAALSAGENSSISREFADTLWGILRAAFALATLAGAYGLTLLWGRIRRPEWILLAGLNGLLIVLACLLFVFPDWQVDDAGMRIVWQLIQATIAGAILAAGCWLIFAKRSGVVLLHVGILVLMGHEFYTAKEAVEAHMTIAEGETVNYTYNSRQRELALIDTSHREYDQVVAIPEVLVRQAAQTAADSPDRLITHPDLPVDIRVAEYSRNSTVKEASPADRDRVTLGAGKLLKFEPAKPVAGVGADQGIDIPYAYLDLLDKETGEVVDKVLVSLMFDSHQFKHPDLIRFEKQALEIAGTPYTIGLRFRQHLKPYSVTLNDFRFDRYVGTNQAKSYSSDVRLVDHELGAELTYKISMNNPLRYRGETFYQSSFDGATEAATILQVVKNEGWMLPYLGCMLVLIGMMVHFTISISRFASRRARERNPQTPEVSSQPTWGQRLASPAVWAPAITIVLAAMLLSRSAIPTSDAPGEFAVHDFGRLPIVHQGRMKPFDTLARNLLQSMCQRQEAATKVKARGDENVPATQWLLDVISRKEGWDQYYVYRIDNLELIDSMDLLPRQGFYRYTHEEVFKGLEKVRGTLESMEKADRETWTPFQTSLAELQGKHFLTELLAISFRPPDLMSMENPVESMLYADRVATRIMEDERVPRTLVPDSATGTWMTPFEAGLRQQCTIIRHAAQEQLAGAPPVIQAVIEKYATGDLPSSIATFENALAAYRQDDVEAFNQGVERYRQQVDSYEADLHRPENLQVLADMVAVERLDSARIDFEDTFNAVSPFYHTAILYFFALVLSAGAWMVAPRALGRSATALLILTLVIHTLAIGARIYISGRPPITNIYTTLIFVGWFSVIAMLVLEAIFKVGIGNFVASVIGLATMVIAHNLGMDGDTFTVLQAVLDTQFWLTTHVITINIGYGATIIAGAIGIAYLVRVNLLRQADKQEEQKLGKMLYGTICFALLFSFVGTVLGGLWADDSWGRFWGWDPKENGALMIVLWNAVALHARWAGMIGSRGVALLAIIGNMITAWSWFGVNQLGQGMHSYGFNDELARYLLLFVVSQIAILAVGLCTLPGISRVLFKR